MENKFVDERGETYILLDENKRYAYLRHENSHPNSMGERFSIRDFNSKFHRRIHNFKYFSNLDIEAKIAVDIVEKNRGSYIKDVSQSNNAFNGAGLSIQSVLGIPKENSKMGYDIGNIDLKVQKNTRLKNCSPISLFTMNPMCFTDKVKRNASVNKYLAQNYGYPDRIEKHLNCLSVHIHTKKYTSKGIFDFKLKVDNKDKRIYIVIRKNKRIVSKKDFGYTFDYLYKRINDKMKNLLIVTYEDKMVNKNKYYELKHSKIHMNINKQVFINMIEQGVIFLNTGVDVKRNFKNKSQNGKLHDHGTEFRLSSDKMGDLYNITEKIY